jgi:hypothetical protein
VAVANHNPEYNSFVKLTPPMIFHAVSNFIAILFFGLALKRSEAAVAK